MNNQNGYNNFNNANNLPNGYHQPQNNYNNWGPPPSNNNGLATSSLILGILSFVLSCFNFLWIGFFLGVPMAVLAIIFGACSKPKTGFYAGRRPGTGTAGLILGVIFLSIYLFILLAIFILYVMSNNTVSPIY